MDKERVYRLWRKGSNSIAKMSKEYMSPHFQGAKLFNKHLSV